MPPPGRLKTTESNKRQIMTSKRPISTSKRRRTASNEEYRRKKPRRTKQVPRTTKNDRERQRKTRTTNTNSENDVKTTQTNKKQQRTTSKRPHTASGGRQSSAGREIGPPPKWGLAPDLGSVESEKGRNHGAFLAPRAFPETGPGPARGLIDADYCSAANSRCNGRAKRDPQKSTGLEHTS